jgi:hypothetical protein
MSCGGTRIGSLEDKQSDRIPHAILFQNAPKVPCVVPWLMTWERTKMVLWQYGFECDCKQDHGATMTNQPFVPRYGRLPLAPSGEYPNPSGLPAALPERRVEDFQEMVLPSGRVYAIYEIVETFVEPPLRYVTRHRTGSRPALHCSCRPRDAYDISECSNPKCMAVTCLEHSDTCPLCGAVYCTRCLVGATVDGIPMAICRVCEKRHRPSAVVQLFRMLRGS